MEPARQIRQLIANDPGCAGQAPLPEPVTAQETELAQAYMTN